MQTESDPELPERKARFYYFHTDQIGTSQEMTNTEGQVGVNRKFACLF
ncbi:hypothetical protein N181_31200 [Sinorhizobium fredii USDA 205]|uniref:RHS protein conserved region domain-containing protein n=1 Tax=Rhizobium fredii TaxID=380 RepID=A0A844A5Y5_RHIFR|nr:hypothetical protein N181_31200 [Sinorhizobium fredii USDA 205]MQX06930.1 hypothetical protein [Sinorhizobium fredii]